MSDGSHRESANPFWKPTLEGALKDYADINWRIGYTEGKYGKERAWPTDADKAETIREVIIALAGRKG